MNYVMSDIYGDVERFGEMLGMIDLKEEDNLYLLGNFIGGEGSAELLTQLAESVNIFPIMGAVEKAALDVLELMTENLNSESAGNPTDEMKTAAAKLAQLGGRSVISEFITLDADTKGDLLDFMSELPLFEICDTDDAAFILVPRGLGSFDKNGKKLKKYTFEDLALTEVDYNRNYMDDDKVFIVSGSVPVQDIGGENKVYTSNNNICINGDLKNGGRLICLCLDTMKEYYVE